MKANAELAINPLNDSRMPAVNKTRMQTFGWVADSSLACGMSEWEELRHLACLKVYVARAGSQKQSEWICQEIAECMWESKQGDKVRERMENSILAAERMHSLVWPNSPIPDRKYSKRSAKSLGENNATLGIFNENTLATSMLMALLVSVACRSKGARSPRSSAHKLLKNIWARICTHLNGAEVTLLQASATRPTLVQVVFDETGSTRSRLWTAELHEAMVKFWQLDLCSEGRSWITSTVEKPNLADFICFGLSPASRAIGNKSFRQHSDLLGQLQRCATYALGMVAKLLEQHLVSVSVPSCDIVQPKKQVGNPAGKSKNKPHQKMSAAEFNSRVASAIESMYSKEAESLQLTGFPNSQLEFVQGQTIAFLFPPALPSNDVAKRAQLR